MSDNLNITKEEGLAIAFSDFLGERYIKLHGGWIPKYADQRMVDPFPTKILLRMFYSTSEYKDFINQY